MICECDQNVFYYCQIDIFDLQCTCLFGDIDRDGLVPRLGLIDRLVPPKGLVVLPGDLLRGVLIDVIDDGS